MAFDAYLKTYSLSGNGSTKVMSFFLDIDGTILIDRPGRINHEIVEQWNYLKHHYPDFKFFYRAFTARQRVISIFNYFSDYLFLRRQFAIDKLASTEAHHRAKEGIWTIDKICEYLADRGFPIEVTHIYDGACIPYPTLGSYYKTVLAPYEEQLSMMLEEFVSCIDEKKLNELLANQTIMGVEHNLLNWMDENYPPYGRLYRNAFNMGDVELAQAEKFISKNTAHFTIQNKCHLLLQILKHDHGITSVEDLSERGNFYAIIHDDSDEVCKAMRETSDSLIAAMRHKIQIAYFYERDPIPMAERLNAINKMMGVENRRDSLLWLKAEGSQLPDWLDFKP